jgi:hypothetical protein
LNSDVQSIITRNDPARWSRPLVHRTKAQLPFDPSQVPAGASLLFDATVYIDQLKGQLPTSIVNLLASRTILHGAPALGELAVTIGVLDPADRRTHATLLPIIETLVRINPTRIIAPSYEVWLEAAVIAGILARTQAIPKQDRRKFLNDVLLFLQAAAVGAVSLPDLCAEQAWVEPRKHRRSFGRQSKRGEPGDAPQSWSARLGSSG